MEAPLCKICGKRHYVAPSYAAKLAKLTNWIPAAEPPIRKEGAKFDRNVYQREYMRRRRAKKP